MMIPARCGIRTYFRAADAHAPFAKTQETTLPNAQLLTKKEGFICTPQLKATGWIHCATLESLRQCPTVVAAAGSSSQTVVSNEISNFAAVRLRLHIVESGDTLTSVAERYGVSLKQLRLSNGRTGVHEVTLRVGEVLYLPIRDFTRVEGFSSGNVAENIFGSNLLARVKSKLVAWAKSAQAINFTSTVPLLKEHLSFKRAPSRLTRDADSSNDQQQQSATTKLISNPSWNAPRSTSSSSQASQLSFATLQSHVRHIHSPLAILPGWITVAAAAVAASILVMQVWKLLSGGSSGDRNSSSRSRKIPGRGLKVSGDVKGSKRRTLSRFGLPREELRHVLGLPDSMKGSELAGVALTGVIRAGEQERSRMNVWGDCADAASVLSVQEASADALQDDQLGGGIGEYGWLTTPSPRFKPDANAVMGSSFREVLQSQLITESELTESGSGAGKDDERIELGEWSVGMAKDANARASST